MIAHPLATALALAALVTASTLGQPFLFDDHFHLAVCEAATAGDDGPRGAYLEQLRDAFGLWSLFEFHDGSEATWRASVETGAAPWWTVEGLRLSFWRPLSSQLELLDYRLFGDHPLPYHLHSVAWYLLLLAAWWWVLRGTLPRQTAVLALLLYAVDEAHHMPVDWIANRHALVSTALGVLGLAAYLRWCRDRWRPGLPLALLGFALALLGGETALGVLAYTGAYAVFHPGEAGPDGRPSHVPWLRRLGRALPVVALAAAWAVVYRIGGFGAWGSGSYLEPTSGEYWLAAGPRMVVMVGDQLGRLPSDLWSFVPALRPVLLAQGLIGVVAVGLWLRFAWHELEPDERSALRWMLPGALLALIPAVAVEPAARQLLVPGLGGAVLLAVLIRAGLRHWDRRKEKLGVARLTMIAAIALLCMHLPSPPISWYASTSALTRIARQGTALAAQTVPLLADADGEHVVVLVAPDAAVGVYLPLELYRRDVPFPASWHTLSLAPHDLRWTRTDARTLRFDVVDGELLATHGERMGRHPRYPLAAGDEVELGFARLRVDAVGEHGPTGFSLRFDDSAALERVRWLSWDGDALQPVDPPAVGEAGTLPYVPGPLAF